MKTGSRNNILLRARHIFCLIGILFLSASLSTMYAQQTTGSIVGTVKDQSGAVVSTATVKATNLETGFSRAVPTNELGQYRIDYLPIGKYTVAADAASFKHFVQENIELNIDQTLTVEIALAIGAATETVTVTDAPPLVNTSTAELGRIVQGQEIVGLPLVNRNAYSELSLTPGVMTNSASQNTNPQGTPNFIVGVPSTAVQI